MAEFLRLLLDAIQYVWPFRMVRSGQMGVLYVWGRARRTLGPGVYPIVWWFMDVRAIPVVRDNYETGLQTITTKDDGTLTFMATASLVVTDAKAAQTEAVKYDETAMEDVAAVLADTLADLEVGRLDPDKRRGLLRTCTAAINTQINTYGVHVTNLRFNTFVRNVRGYRVYGDLK